MHGPIPEQALELSAVDCMQIPSSICFCLGKCSWCLQMRLPPLQAAADCCKLNFACTSIMSHKCVGAITLRDLPPPYNVRSPANGGCGLSRILHAVLYVCDGCLCACPVVMTVSTMHRQGQLPSKGLHARGASELSKAPFFVQLPFKVEQSRYCIHSLCQLSA